MKLLWVGALLVAGLSFYDPEFMLVFSVIIVINLIIGSHKNSIKILRCMDKKQKLLSLQRVKGDIEKEVNTCYSNISKHNKGNHTD